MIPQLPTPILDKFTQLAAEIRAIEEEERLEQEYQDRLYQERQDAYWEAREEAEE